MQAIKATVVFIAILCLFQAGMTVLATANTTTISLGLSGISELTGEVTLDAAGITLISVGDVNNDSYDDFLAGTKTNDETGLNAGAAYLVYGKSTPIISESLGGSSNTITKFTGEASGDYAGANVGPAGDVNNDGFADFLITSYQPGAVSPGAAYLIYGQAEIFASKISLSDSSIVKFTGEATGDSAGSKAVSPGDVNNDGYSDILISAVSNDTSALNAGAVYLIYGQAAHLTSRNLNTADAQLTGEASSDSAGTFLAGGDINGDGFDDMLISATGWGASNWGRTYLYYGKATAITSGSLGAADAIFTGEGVEDASGVSISTGDLNNDSFNDILIGSAGNDDAGSNAGAIYLIYGQAEALASVTLGAIEFTGEAAGDQASNLGIIGDINKDTFDDILIGAVFNDDSAADAGATYLVYGQSAAFTSGSLSTIAATEFTGEVAGDRSGTWVNGSGDINGDGVNDILICGRLNDDNGVDAGAVYIIYNQPPFASVSAATQTAAETIGTITVTAQISSLLPYDVVVPFTLSGTATGAGSDYTIVGSNITIPTGLASADITITIINDAVDESDETIIFTLNTPNYGSLSGTTAQTITITDNDTAGITVGTISGATTEAGGAATATIVLTSQPTADVTIGLTTSDSTEGTVSPASFTFTSVNWATPQTVTATGVNDDIDDGNIVYSIVTAAATSADPNYSALAVADISVTNNDNDTAGATITESAAATDVTEGGATDTYTVVLTAQPSENVTVTVTGDTQASVSAASLTFTSVNWADPQTITVTAVNDAIDEALNTGTITHTSTSVDGLFNGLVIASVVANVTDNDTAGITVGTISGATTEAGGAATATIVLNSQPTADVTIGLTTSDSTEGTVSPASFTFTSVNWAAPQTVTATGVNDDIDDGNIVYSIVTAAATSADPNYSALAVADISVTNNDNDTAGATITESAASTDVTEGGATDTYTIVLTSQPVASVVVAAVVTTGQASINLSSLTFTTSNWATPQTIIVTAVDNYVVEIPSTDTITHTVTSADPLYENFSLAAVSVAVTDNDHPGPSVFVNPIWTEAKTLTVVSPVLDTRVSGGNTVNVAWNWTGLIPVVSVYLSTDDGASWIAERSNIANTGSVSFTSPVIATTHALVKVVGSDLVTTSATSESPVFTIYLAATDDEITSIYVNPSADDYSAALPASVAANMLVKAAAYPAVYAIGTDGRRHAFPNERVYFTWYSNFNDVVTISADDLASIPLGINVIYKPGSRMVKFITSPKVYAVDRGGILRWVMSEEVAVAIYGTAWNTMIDDISDAFFSNYSFGSAITTATDYDLTSFTDIMNPSDVM